FLFTYSNQWCSARREWRWRARPLRLFRHLHDARVRGMGARPREELPPRQKGQLGTVGGGVRRVHGVACRGGRAMSGRMNWARAHKLYRRMTTDHRFEIRSAVVMLDGSTSISRDEAIAMAEQAHGWALESKDHAERRDLVSVERAWRLLALNYDSFDALKAR